MNDVFRAFVFLFIATPCAARDHAAPLVPFLF